MATRRARLLLLALALGGSGTAQARPLVSALLSKSSAPYQQAYSGFKRSWDGPVKAHVLELEEDAIARVRAEQPAVVLAIGSRAAKAAAALSGVPVVHCMVLDPDRLGLDGARILGVPLEIPVEVQLGELRRVLPKVRTVGLVFNPTRSSRELSQAVAASARLGLTLLAEPAASAAEFPAALKQLLPRADALWVVADSTVITQETFQLMLESALVRGLPLLAFSDEFVQQGALLGLAPDFEASGIEAARLARELAAGRKPADIAPAQARWNLVVNLSTARTLGITVPPDVLGGAVAVH